MRAAILGHPGGFAAGTGGRSRPSSNPSHAHVGAVDGGGAQPGSQAAARRGPRRRASLLQLVLTETAAATAGAGAAAAAAGRERPGGGGSGDTAATAPPPEGRLRPPPSAASELPAWLMSSAPALGGGAADGGPAMGREEGDFVELRSPPRKPPAAPGLKRGSATGQVEAPQGSRVSSGILAARLLAAGGSGGGGGRVVGGGGMGDSFVGPSARSFTVGGGGRGPGGRGGAGEGGHSRAARRGPEKRRDGVISQLLQDMAAEDAQEAAAAALLDTTASGASGVLQHLDHLSTGDMGLGMAWGSVMARVSGSGLLAARASVGAGAAPVSGGVQQQGQAGYDPHAPEGVLSWERPAAAAAAAAAAERPLVVRRGSGGGARGGEGQWHLPAAALPSVVLGRVDSATAARAGAGVAAGSAAGYGPGGTRPAASFPEIEEWQGP